jgi:hypothetical protein
MCIRDWAGAGPNVQHLTGPAGNAPVDGPC